MNITEKFSASQQTPTITTENTKKKKPNNKPLPRILLRGCTVFPPSCEPFCEVLFIALNIFG